MKRCPSCLTNPGILGNLGSLACLMMFGICFTGCATGVDHVKLYDPLTYQVPKNTGADVAYDAAIQDVKPETSERMKLAIRKVRDTRLDISSIGVKKNTYGMAMGKIDVEESVNLLNLFKKNLINCLELAGYEVVDASQTREKIGSEPSVDVDIRMFWVEFMPGFFVVDAASNVIFEMRLIDSQTNQEIWSDTFRGKGKVSSGFAVTKDMFEQSINIAYAEAMKSLYVAIADGKLKNLSNH